MKPGKRKNYLLLIIAAVIIWVALLAVLYFCESREPGSNIRTVGDALWYMIVTVTTVGYGDVAPVTHVGRIIGAIFLISSMGILVALLSTVFTFITSEGWPEMKLRFSRGKNWYYFAGFSEEADVLARDIMTQDPMALIIFGGQKGEDKAPYHCIFVKDAPARIVRLKGKAGRKCSIFFMQEDDFKRNALSVDVNRLNAEVYVRTSRGPSNKLENIHYFHAYDCCAREYWRTHPLVKDERSIVIVGFGNYGKSLLERAILTNIVSQNDHIIYHVFGDASEFLMIHNKLKDVLSINSISEYNDSIIFYEDQWEAHRDVIADASRIILCNDDEECVWEDYWRMNQFYMTSGRIDVRSNRPRNGFSVFGNYDAIFSVRQVIRANLNYAAYAMNELYIQGHPGNAAGWDELSDELQRSKIAVADHLNAKVRILLDDETLTDINAAEVTKAAEEYQRLKQDPEMLEKFRRIEHKRWRRYYAYNNWSYAENWDAKRRLHPMMVPYDKLTGEQKSSHDAAWELIGFVAPKLQEYENKAKREGL